MCDTVSVEAGDGSGGRPLSGARLHSALIDAGTWRPLNSPRPIVLHANIALGWAGRVAGRQPPPLRVRSWGLAPPPQLPATLTGWARFNTGLWAAVIDVEVPTFNGQDTLPATLWVPPDTITPADTE